jgi:hypothetical protein
MAYTSILANIVITREYVGFSKTRIQCGNYFLELVWQHLVLGRFRICHFTDGDSKSLVPNAIIIISASERIGSFESCRKERSISKQPAQAQLMIRTLIYLAHYDTDFRSLMTE